tara:strand:+ start:4141 stop:7320 length:3180 start_codon:yes stop_codon:yes gene_type:complete
MKFKRVEIQAFKSYLDKVDGTFDLTVGEEPADIISLFAPNGFGKTSFYDAIDFCMTNNITRFIRDASLANLNNENAKTMNKKGEKQHLLRSKHAPDNYKSQVRITTNTGEYLSEELRARAGSKDYTFDDSRTKENQRYFRDVMLSQEAIDGFLREGKPEDRYSKFMDSQLGGDDSFENSRKCILMMLNEISTKETNTKAELNKLKEQNLTTDVKENSITVINEQIFELNKLGCDFDEIDNKLTENAKNKLLLQLTSYEQSNSDIKNKRIDERDKLTRYLNQLSIYEYNNNKIIETKHKIEKLINQKKDLSELTKLTSKEVVLSSQLASARTDIETLQNKRKLVSKYIEIGTQKKKAIHRSEELNKILTLNAEANYEIQVNLEELEKKNNLLSSEVESNEIRLKNIPTYFSRIKELGEIIKQNDSSILQTELNNLSNRISILNTDSILLRSLLISDKASIQASKYVDTELIVIARNYETLEEDLSLTDVDLSQTDEKMKAAMEQSKAISELLTLGGRLVVNHQGENCPLCQHKHESFEALSNKINNNSSLDDIQKKLLVDFRKLKALKQIKYDRCLLAELAFHDLQEKMAIELDTELNKIHIEIASKKNELTQKTIMYEAAVLEQEKLKDLTEHCSIEELEGRIKASIKRVRREKQANEEQIKKFNEQEQINNKNIQSYKIELTSIAGWLESPKVNEFFNGYSDYLVSQSAPIVTFEDSAQENILISFLDNISKEISDYFVNLTNISDENSQAINTIRARYSSTFLESVTLKEQETLSQLESSNEVLSKLNSESRQFFEIVKKLQLLSFLEGNDWNKLKDAFEAKVSELQDFVDRKESLLESLQTLRKVIGEVSKYVDYIESTAKINQLISDNKTLEAIKIPLELDLKNINALLKEKVSRYFYTDLINTIYSKIDPHPEFKKIKFECDFPESGRPRLQVYIEDKAGKEVVSPTLSFSSAQVNVLSLSIFLAKAINTVDNNGNPVDCIFIDDPVQSMDSINVLGVIDLLRNLSTNLGKQIIVSTHDENFYALLKKKMPPNLFKSKYLELESFGKVKAHVGQ